MIVYFDIECLKVKFLVMKIDKYILYVIAFVDLQCCYSWIFIVGSRMKVEKTVN